jgi:4-amino-4-deoxy-L-arabinose transferase-like glycosyltransferase
VSALQTATPSSKPSSVLFWTFALGYVAVFLAYFHSVHLFGTGETPEGRMRRYYLLGTSLTPSPESAFVDLGHRLAKTQHLYQRGPLLVNALGILGAAVLLGDAFLALAVGRRRLGGWTRFVLAFGLGAGLLSLVVLGLGLAGALRPASAYAVGLAIPVAWTVLRLASRSREPARIVPPEASAPGWKTRLLLLVVMGLFGLMSLMSACLPTTDYDAVGYHLLAPREWFEAGRIHFLPHNVYASFPFLTEMFHLLGMTAVRDWFAGGLVGQVVLWSFGPMGALAVGLLATRLFGRASGWAAATIYLTTPWVFRLSAIPYVEGTSLFFGAIALLAFVDAVGLRGFLLVGAAVGGAASCKYTSLVMLGVPLGAAVVWTSWQTRSWRPLVGFALGGAIVFGPWLIRNVAWTGNPVYPLAYSVFDGFNWTPEKAAKFAAGHRSTDFSPPALFRYLAEIPVHSDWQSGLIFAFAPLPLAICLFRRRAAGNACASVWGLAALVGWQFLAFWLFTHRLDRFWLPLLPAACALAGAGWSATPATARAYFVNPAVALVALYNFAYCTTSYCALNDYTANLMEHRRFSRAAASKAVQLADEGGKIPPGATVLYVGFAGVYYSERPFRYNSVFDDSILELLAADPSSANGLRPLHELRRRFREAGIDFIVVDWEWIRKYRGPGNYGYTDFVTPERFLEMMRLAFLWRVYSEAESLPDPKNPERRLEIYRVQFEAAAP